MVSLDSDSTANEGILAETGAKQSRKRSMPRWEADGRERIKIAVRKFGKALADLRDRDANEADTRLFVTDFLCDALGYDKYAELSTEYRVKNEYVDYGIRLDNDMTAFIEVKRLNTKLGAKHLRQAQSYAVNEGVEWIFLTNGAQWQVYHLSGGLPIITDLVLEADMFSDEPPSKKVDALFFLSRDALKRGKLAELWQARRATCPSSLSAILLTSVVLGAIRKELKKQTGYAVDTEEIKRLLRETCLQPDCLAK